MASLRHTTHALVVLETLLSVKDSMWTVRMVADDTDFSYGTCYALLKRLTERHMVQRSYLDEGVGSPKLYFEINAYGTKKAKAMLKVMPNPRAFLDACIVEDETSKPRLTVVGAVS
jgi:DNA-binding PadR family transcriptional regulator